MPLILSGMPNFKSNSWRQASRGEWRRRRRAVFWGILTAVFLVSGMVGLMYFVYQRQMH